MPYITLENISFAVGTDQILDGVNLQLMPGDKIALVGRNGMGKSTLMRMVAKMMAPDEGRIKHQPGLKLAFVPQTLEPNDKLTVQQWLEQGYSAIATEATEDQYWLKARAVQRLVDQLDLPAEQLLSHLSGGWLRKVAIAKAMVAEPQVLLLDEPTNHLDIETIQWLENRLTAYKGALLFVSHDRHFLQRIATGIVDIDRGKLTAYPATYSEYTQKKRHDLQVEANQAAKFDKNLAQEEVWIRQGIKARGTRNEGRVRALKALRQTHAKRRQMLGDARFNVGAGLKSGQLVAQLQTIEVKLGGQEIIKDFSLRLLRGERLGLVGPNGAGKTTLIKTLLGELTPDKGEVRLGSKLTIAYFDQRRANLDPHKTAMDIVGEGSDQVVINGQPRHILSYLQDFLFTPLRARTALKVLSGGEQNRVLLASILKKSHNLLVLDEPTNDLDIETLELLEDYLSHYSGTVLIASHDRYFLDNVVTGLLVFNGTGYISRHVGSYQDYHAGLEQAKTHQKNAAKQQKKQAKTRKETHNKDQKLSYHQQRELAAMPAQIEQLEQSLSILQQAQNQPQFYKRTANEIKKDLLDIEQNTQQLELAFKTWEQLEAQQQVPPA